MIQHALRLIKMGIEEGLKRKFGTDSMSLLNDVRKIASVQQLKKILRALSEVSTADDLRKLIQGPSAPQLEQQPLPPPPQQQAAPEQPPPQPQSQAQQLIIQQLPPQAPG